MNTIEHLNDFEAARLDVAGFFNPPPATFPDTFSAYDVAKAVGITLEVARKVLDGGVASGAVVKAGHRPAVRWREGWTHPKPVGRESVFMLNRRVVS